MKKFTLLLTFCLFSLFAFAQAPYTWTSVQAGNWDVPGTWTVIGNPNEPAYDYPQTSDDIVIIENIYSVTANVNVTVQSIKITNTGSFSQLLLTPNFTINTTGDFVIMHETNGGILDRSSLTFNGGGTLNVGGGITIDGLILASGDSKIDVGSFYKHNTGKVSFSGNMELDISTAGAIPAGTDEHNFFIGENAEYAFGTGTVNLLIDIFNGNLGTKEEIYLEDATVANNSSGGFISTLITNTDGQDNSYAMKTDMGLGQVEINIGDATMTYENVTSAKNVIFRELFLFSGHFDMQPASLLEIEPTATFF